MQHELLGTSTKNCGAPPTCAPLADFSASPTMHDSERLHRAGTSVICFSMFEHVRSGCHFQTKCQAARRPEMLGMRGACCLLDGWRRVNHNTHFFKYPPPSPTRASTELHTTHAMPHCPDTNPTVAPRYRVAPVLVDPQSITRRRQPARRPKVSVEPPGAPRTATRITPPL